MFNVIEFSESVREYGRISEYSEVKVFKDLIDIFDEYIDVEYVKGWFNKDSIVLSDVLDGKNGLFVMSVSEDMSLYIFNEEGKKLLEENEYEDFEDICFYIESVVFDLESC